MLQYALALFVAFTLAAQSTKEPPAKAYDVPEAYEVYAAVLALDPPKGDLLIAESTVPFNSCQDAHSDKSVASAIADYKRTNKDSWLLQKKFDRGRNYKLLSQKEISDLKQPDPKGGFFWYFPDETEITHLSAVGFNANKTVAFVEMDVQCGGLCGRGTSYALEKRDGKWQEWKDHRTAKVTKRKKNPDGSWTVALSGGPYIGYCGWNY